MPANRRIIYSKECDDAARKLGGYKRIDDSLTTAIHDALQRNPYGFPAVEADWFSARYIVTKPFKDVPALIWTFVISKTDVIIEHVEEYETY
jgi:hypothetical protein